MEEHLRVHSELVKLRPQKTLQGLSENFPMSWIALLTTNTPVLSDSSKDLHLVELGSHSMSSTGWERAHYLWFHKWSFLFKLQSGINNRICNLTRQRLPWTEIVLFSLPLILDMQEGLSFQWISKLYSDQSQWWFQMLSTSLKFYYTVLASSELSS